MSTMQWHAPAGNRTPTLCNVADFWAVHQVRVPCIYLLRGASMLHPQLVLYWFCVRKKDSTALCTGGESNPISPLQRQRERCYCWGHEGNKFTRSARAVDQSWFPPTFRVWARIKPLVAGMSANKKKKNDPHCHAPGEIEPRLTMQFYEIWQDEKAEEKVVGNNPSRAPGGIEHRLTMHHGRNRSIMLRLPIRLPISFCMKTKRPFRHHAPAGNRTPSHRYNMACLIHHAEPSYRPPNLVLNEEKKMRPCPPRTGGESNPVSPLQYGVSDSSCCLVWKRLESMMTVIDPHLRDKKKEEKMFASAYPMHRRGIEPRLTVAPTAKRIMLLLSIMGLVARYECQGKEEKLFDGIHMHRRGIERRLTVATPAIKIMLLLIPQPAHPSSSSPTSPFTSFHGSRDSAQRALVRLGRATAAIVHLPCHRKKRKERRHDRQRVSNFPSASARFPGDKAAFYHHYTIYLALFSRGGIQEKWPSTNCKVVSGPCFPKTQGILVQQPRNPNSQPPIISRGMKWSDVTRCAAFQTIALRWRDGRSRKDATQNPCPPETMKSLTLALFVVDVRSDERVKTLCKRKMARTGRGGVCAVLECTRDPARAGKAMLDKSLPSSSSSHHFLARRRRRTTIATVYATPGVTYKLPHVSLRIPLLHPFLTNHTMRAYPAEMGFKARAQTSHRSGTLTVTAHTAFALSSSRRTPSLARCGPHWILILLPLFHSLALHHRIRAPAHFPLLSLHERGQGRGGRGRGRGRVRVSVRDDVVTMRLMKKEAMDRALRRMPSGSHLYTLMINRPNWSPQAVVYSTRGVVVLRRPISLHFQVRAAIPLPPSLAKTFGNRNRARVRRRGRGPSAGASAQSQTGALRPSQRGVRPPRPKRERDDLDSYARRASSSAQALSGIITRMDSTPRLRISSHTPDNTLQCRRRRSRGPSAWRLLGRANSRTKTSAARQQELSEDEDLDTVLGLVHRDAVALAFGVEMGSAEGGAAETVECGEREHEDEDADPILCRPLAPTVLVLLVVVVLDSSHSCHNPASIQSSTLCSMRFLADPLLVMTPRKNEYADTPRLMIAPPTQTPTPALRRSRVVSCKERTLQASTASGVISAAGRRVYARAATLLCMSCAPDGAGVSSRCLLGKEKAVWNREREG
ncbi:hypothetical protein DFH06DRAFT_1145845 [Mycena polygramma]|nr:hypothetical protein DFH06DRAFT_1145845 [Mycena polygramma]